MTISIKIQVPAGSNRPIVAAGESFIVRMDSSLADEKGTIGVKVGGAVRKFALNAGGQKLDEHPVFIDQPEVREIFDWGTAADAGSKVNVSVTSDAVREDEAPIV